MARQDLIVVALVFVAMVGAFAIDKSPSTTPSKSSSPAKSPSYSSSTASTKSSSDGRAPKSAPVGAPKSFSSSSSPGHSKSCSPESKEGSSFDSESVEVVSFPPSPNVTDKVLSLLHALKSKGDAVDSESPTSNNDSPAPAPFNSDATKAIIGIVNIVVFTGFFLF
ncbi:classical arabinogalactan protein 6-like [Gossypium raimondii]|uniref:classical arabinogalactan protein 6-like n=1 Tax=Gossypium raimondii TaxID=29730 RepID=UPI00063AB5EC|nr:classical arabinogalactan protein 6-like [Gossypium raimondii]